MKNLTRRLFLHRSTLGVHLFNTFDLFIFKKLTKLFKIEDSYANQQSYTFIRDTVKLDKNLLKYLQEIQQRQTVNEFIIIGRLIKIIDDSSFHNIDLIFVCDSFEGNDKLVTISVDEQTQKGVDGNDGRSITIISKDYKGINAKLNGTNGAAGANGKNGVSGHSGKPNTANTRATKGENGQKGGNGGNSGKLLVYSESEFVIGTTNLIAAPGVKGHGGKGGNGGYNLVYKYDAQSHGAYYSPNGQAESGNPGSDGKDGETFLAELRTITEAQRIMKIKEIGIEEMWSNYRTNVGEYLFRNISSPETFDASKSTTEKVDFAANEFENAFKIM